MGLTISANYLDNSSIMSFSPMSICSHIKGTVITVSCPLLPLDARELLEVEVAALTIGWATISCTSYEPTPLGEVQGAVDAISGGPLVLWLFCFSGYGLSIIAFPDLMIIRQVWSKVGFGNFARSIGKSHWECKKYVQAISQLLGVLDLEIG